MRLLLVSRHPSMLFLIVTGFTSLNIFCDCFLAPSSANFYVLSSLPRHLLRSSITLFFRSSKWVLNNIVGYKADKQEKFKATNAIYYLHDSLMQLCPYKYIFWTHTSVTRRRCVELFKCRCLLQSRGNLLVMSHFWIKLKLGGAEKNMPKFEVPLNSLAEFTIQYGVMEREK